jgi:DNA (cytosine-5)-methyltransferase 1
VVLVENVLELALDWELFDWWRQGMEMLGYETQFISVSSVHIGGPDNDPAAQWRDRFYGCFTRKGIPLPDNHSTASPVTRPVATSRQAATTTAW